MTWRRLVPVLLCALPVVGCNAAEPPVDAATARDMAFFAQAADAAQAGGATDEQVEVLRHAALTGDLTAAEVTPLLEPFFDCLADSGMVGEIEGTMQVGPNVTLPQIVVSYPDMELDTEDQIRAASDKRVACEDKHMGYAWKAIQLAPTTVEAWDADFARRTPAILACIRENGGSVDDDAAVNEIVEAAVAVVEKTGERCMNAR